MHKMQKKEIRFSHVLKHMKDLRDEFNEIVEELEILSSPTMKQQIEDSLQAEKEGKTAKYSLNALKKDIGL